MSEQRFPYTDGTTLHSDPSRVVHIANLEWRVVEAAVARRVEQKRELFSMTGVELCWQEDDAVDSLIAAREAELKEE